MKDNKKLFKRLAIDDKYAGILWSTVKIKSINILNADNDIFRITYEFNTVENKVGTIVFPKIFLGLNFKEIEEEFDEHDVKAGDKTMYKFFTTPTIKGSWLALATGEEEGYFIVNMPE